MNLNSVNLEKYDSVLSKEIVLNQTILAFKFNDYPSPKTICLCKLINSDKESGNVEISDILVYEDEISNGCKKKIISNRGGIIFPITKTFYEVYKTYFFDIKNFRSFRNLEERYGPIIYTDLEKLFDDINSGNVNKSDISFVEYRASTESFYDLTTGEWLDHYKKFNSYYQMVTSEKYDIPNLYSYLRSLNNVIVTEYDFSDEKKSFINFYVLITKEKQNYIKNGYNELPEEIIDISRFKKDTVL